MPKLTKLLKRLLLLFPLACVVFFTFFWLRAPAGTVLGKFRAASGSVISHMLPGSPRLKQEDGVTNILLIGIDRRSSVPYTYQGIDGAVVHNGFLADTIMVASVNSAAHRVSLLSLPRDLWVTIPAYGDLQKQYSKINAAHALGDRFSNEENGGILLVKEVVEEIADIPIHYWARIDFEGFEKGVDAVEGVDILVERSFDDYMFPRLGFENAAWEQRWEYVHFDTGVQHMDGATALKYARSRHAYGPEGTDFARAQRQQNVIIALKNKVISSETLFSVTKIKALYGAVANNLKTDIELSEIPYFFSLAQDLALEEIKTYSLTDQESRLLTTPADISLYGNAWVLIPTAGSNNFSEVQEYVKKALY